MRFQDRLLGVMLTPAQARELGGLVVALPDQAEALRELRGVPNATLLGQADPETG